MKYRQILLIILIILSLKTLAQSSQIQKINNDTELVEGSIYILRGFNYSTSETYSLDGSLIRDNDSIYQFKRVEDLVSAGDKSIGYSNLWKLCKINGQWGLMNLNYGSRFLSSSPNDYNNSFSYLKKTFDSSCYVKFIGSADDMKINVGGKDFIYYNKVYYTFYPRTKRKCINVQICRINNPIILCDENEDLQKVSPVVVTIKLAKTLKNDDVNTFVVPFDIHDYKKLFGANAHVYIPTDYNDYKISFTELGDNDIIKANTPYLLEGKFNSGAYIINNVMLDFNGEQECIYNVGTLTIHGVYKMENIGQMNSYIFNGQNLSKCPNTQNVYIQPYRWFFTSDIEQIDGNRMKLVYNNETTMIAVPSVSVNYKNSIYSLTGVKMNCDESQLHHGIYIINGRKVMK